MEADQQFVCCRPHVRTPQENSGYLVADPSGKNHSASVPNKSTKDTSALLLSSMVIWYAVELPGEPG